MTNTTTVEQTAPATTTTGETTSIVEAMGVAAAKTVKTTLKNADLLWTPKSDKVGGLDTAIQMPRKKLLYRSDNNEPLGIVGEDYEPTDPKEFIETQYEFAEFIKGKVTRAGFIKDRSRAFAFIKMDKDILIHRKSLEKGDPLAAYIYSTDGWDGGTPRKSRLYIERLRCKNGATSREIAASLWVSHKNGMEVRYEKRWKDFLNKVAGEIAFIEEQFNKLAGTEMNADEMKKFAEKLIPGDHGRSEGRRTEIINLFAGGMGNEGTTRWDAYNAVTEFVTHQRTYRSTDATSIETNRFLGVLETDTLARTALNLLLN